ncbi:MAG TPA: Na/Pi cotransporter family protein [Kiritimatiellia bacterium]|nr:Na/Pi cotransporter family protein [Kiritimatiellia bacterium]HPA77943.1 Na/Pi cotransporter family protein [Kiritimatiellia bacterium]HQQ04031.1 Na/Pi cotransporter family protein [Kiritimatiellia bacterium]
MNLSLCVGILFQVLGGLGVFLLGMKHMSEGMQAVSGSSLRKLIAAVTNNRLMAVAVGTLVTCIIQSSSVTTVMVVGLVNSSYMTLMQAIGVIFGANIGTTITGWILTLKIGKYGLPILGVAALFYLFSKKERVRYTAMALVGIGMIFFGLELMSSGFKPLRAIPEFSSWVAAFQADSYFGVLKCAFVGCLLTMIVQSSSAMLGVTMGLACTGIISFQTAAALVLGENIGTTVTAILASLGTGTSARRAACAHMIFNVIGVVWITAAFPYYLKLILALLPNDPSTMILHEGLCTYPHVMTGIAAVHTGFNLINTLVFIPFMPLLARLVSRLVPEKGAQEIPHLTHLDVRMLDSPALGIEQSRREVLFMAESARKMMRWLREIWTAPKPDPELERKLFHREEILDNVQKEVTEFLGKLIAARVTHEIGRESHIQFRVADEFESISDYAASLLKLIKKLRDKKLELSAEGRTELLSLHDRVAEYVEMVSRACRESSSDILAHAYAEGTAITIQAKQYRDEHLARVSQEKVSPLVSLIFTDMLYAYRRIKDHALNIAEAVAGQK